MAAALTAGLLAVSVWAGGSASADVIAAVLVHGNHVTSDDEIIRLAGVAPGEPFASDTVETIRRRLRDLHRFDHVDVLQRFASIGDPSQIVIVIVVDEGPVRLEVPDDPAAPITTVKRRGLTNFMYMPILEGEDGYGLTYGVRLAYVNVTGERGRLSFPLTWGGTKQAGAEFDRTFAGGPVTRVQIGSAVERTRNPAFGIDDDRRRVWGGAERAIGPIRLGASTGWQHVRFGELADRFRSAGVDVTLDTRLDTVLPRNAVFASASWTRLRFTSGPTFARTRLEARGYLGIVGQAVVVVRALREEASRPQPPYLRSLLGGWSNLRGFKAGSFAGDTLTAGSLELRVPTSSPLRLARVGVSVFVDTGTVQATSQRLGDEPFRTGAGFGVWMAITALRLGVSVAHGFGSGTRANFDAGLAF